MYVTPTDIHLLYCTVKLEVEHWNFWTPQNELLNVKLSTNDVRTIVNDKVRELTESIHIHRRFCRRKLGIPDVDRCRRMKRTR